MSERKMRAKMRVGSITPMVSEGKVTMELLRLHGVSKSGGYGADGLDEDNSFAKASPSIDLSLMVANPSLVGAFEVGETFYVDFTPVLTPAA